jgi:hypothetical protein
MGLKSLSFLLFNISSLRKVPLTKQKMTTSRAAKMAAMIRLQVGGGVSELLRQILDFNHAHVVHLFCYASRTKW